MRNLIIDVGLNTGQDTAFYLSQGYSVLAIEADPELAAKARAKFYDEIASGRLHILNVGIAKTEGVAKFWICDNKREFNSFSETIAARDSRTHHYIHIPTIKFATIIQDFGVPHFLKIDIEGNDLLCLDGISSECLPQYLSIESECPTDANDGGPDYGLRVLRKLHSLGYRRFKLIDQYTFCSLTLPSSFHQVADGVCRKTLAGPLKNLPGAYKMSQRVLTKSRLERRFRRKFVAGSSGVWGEDTPGRWMKFDDAARAYKHYRREHFSNPQAGFYSFWCDWHARSGY